MCKYIVFVINNFEAFEGCILKDNAFIGSACLHSKCGRKVHVARNKGIAFKAVVPHRHTIYTKVQLDFPIP